MTKQDVTIIHAAIAWLTERRTRIDQAIETLCQLVDADDLAHDEAPAAAPAPRQKTNGTAVKPQVSRRFAPHQPPVDGGRAHQVASILKSANKPLSPREIRESGDMTSSQVGYGLKVLTEQKLVKAEGATNARRYALTPKYAVVWSGSKERAGDAPSLIGDRTQRGVS